MHLQQPKEGNQYYQVKAAEESYPFSRIITVIETSREGMLRRKSDA